MRLLSGTPSVVVRVLLAAALILGLWVLATRQIGQRIWRDSRPPRADGTAAARRTLVLAEESLEACLGSTAAAADDARVELVRGGRLLRLALEGHVGMRQRRDVAPEIIGALGGMLTSLAHLCQQWNPLSAEIRELPLSEQERHQPSLARYNEARARLDQLLPLGTVERRRLIAGLGPLLSSARQTAVDLVAAERAGDPWAGSAPVADEEWRRQQREVSRQEEWRERQRLERDARHREAIEEWRRGADGGADGGAEAAPDARAGAAAPAAAWAERYRSRTALARAALERVTAPDGGDRVPPSAGCRTLYGAISDVLRDESILAAPRPEAGRLLASGYRAALAGAEACLAGEPERAGDLLAEARRLIQSGAEEAAAP